MTDSEKLAKVLAELKRVAWPDETTNSGEYWDMVECAADNAVDSICGNDWFHKSLIKIIEE